MKFEGSIEFSTIERIGDVQRRKARGDCARWKMSSVMFGILIIIGLSGEWAYPDETGLKPSLSPGNIWVDSIGSGFRKGLLQVGGTVGAGFGVKVFGTTLAHDLASASVNLGWVFTDVMVSNKWYGGNLELLLEIFRVGSSTRITVILLV